MSAFHPLLTSGRASAFDPKQTLAGREITRWEALAPRLGPGYHTATIDDPLGSLEYDESGSGLAILFVGFVQHWQRVASGHWRIAERPNASTPLS
jgi:hypothetical protein